MNSMKAENSLNANHKEKFFRSQAFWQVYFPFFIALITILSAFYYLLRNANEGMLVIRSLADIALIVIVLPFFLVLFLTLIVLIFLIIFTARANEPIHNFFSKASQLSQSILSRCLRMAEIGQKLFIETETWSSFLRKKPDQSNQ